MIDHPELAGLRMKRSALGILEAVRERLGEHGRAVEPGIVLGNRTITVDANDAPSKVAANIRVVGERVFHAIEVRIVEPEAVGAANQ